MTKRRLHPFKFRTYPDKVVRVFYAPNKVEATRYARAWAKRLGYKRIVRLKPRR